MQEVIARAMIEAKLSIDFLQEVQNEYNNAPACIQILVIRMAEKITNDKHTAEVTRNILNKQFNLQ